MALSSSHFYNEISCLEQSSAVIFFYNIKTMVERIALMASRPISDDTPIRGALIALPISIGAWVALGLIVAAFT
jgi:hypothetical protein